jgi:hypothetical protein
MKLKTFNPENTGDDVIPMLSINSNGVFRLNKAAIELLKLNEGDKVLFHQDEDEPEDWYISKDAEKGFIFSIDKTRPNRYSRISALYRTFKECFNNTSVFKFCISSESVKSDKSDKSTFVFPIITKRNLRTKN